MVATEIIREASMSDVVARLPETPAEALPNGSLSVASPDYVINDPKFNRLQATLIDLCEFIRREGASAPSRKSV
jgi:hypothetical protein